MRVYFPTIFLRSSISTSEAVIGSFHIQLGAISTPSHPRSRRRPKCSSSSLLFHAMFDTDSFMINCKNHVFLTSTQPEESAIHNQHPVHPTVSGDIFFSPSTFEAEGLLQDVQDILV